MSEEIDPLEGFRREEAEDYSESESALLKALHDNKGVLEIINAGVDMARFLATPAGKVVWKQAEGKLADSVRTWLSSADPTTPEVRTAHFNAAVAIQVLKAFQDTIDTGREMGQQLRHSEDDEESSNTGRN